MKFDTTIHTFTGEDAEREAIVSGLGDVIDQSREHALQETPLPPGGSQGMYSVCKRGGFYFMILHGLTVGRPIGAILMVHKLAVRSDDEMADSFARDWVHA